MLKIFTLLSLCLSFNSFSAVPTAALTFSTNLSLINATAARETKARSAEALIKKVIGSEAFRTAVLNHSYNGVKTFVDNNGLTNEQIYIKILEAAEQLNNVKNNTMDLTVEFYYNGFTSTVGYTYPDENKIYANTKFYDTYEAASVANNFTHEWLHKLGFSHASSYSVSRDYSVPYAIGDIMESVARSGNFDSGDTTTLTAPTGLTIASVGTSITLKWLVASGATSYKVYRRLSGSTSNYVQGTVTGTSFTQTAPTKDAIYYVRSVNAQGATLKSAEIQYKKPVSTAVTNLTLSRSSTQVTLSWGAATAPAGIKSYKIYRRLSGSTTNYIQGTTTGLTFSQPLPSSNAVYYVRAVDNLDATVKSVEISFIR